MKAKRDKLPVLEKLEAMARTFSERNEVYKDNYKMIGKMMAILFPDGVPSELVIKEQFHLFELLLVKVSRYAISELTHADSIHDAAVYCVMCEAITEQQQTEKED